MWCLVQHSLLSVLLCASVRHAGTVVRVVGCLPKDCRFDTSCDGCILIQVKWQRLVCSVMSAHVKEQQIVKISAVLHYSASHNHMVVVGRETPDIFIIICGKQ